MAEFSTLVSDIQNLFNDGHDLSERIDHLLDGLGSEVVLRFKEYAEERKPTLRLSNIGRPLRQLYYELKGFKGEPLSAEAKLKFLYGNIIESLVLFLAKEAGHTVTDEQRSLEVDGVKGHIDGFIDGVLIDVKSCSTRSFEKFLTGKLFQDDPFGYVGQLSGYKKGLNVERAAFLAIDKQLGRICVLELPASLSEAYDVSERITTVRDAVSRDILPGRCYDPIPVSKTDQTGNLILPVGCSYCAYKYECHKDSNDGQGLQLRHYSNGVKFFVKIVKEPKLKYDKFESFPTKESNIN